MTKLDDGQRHLLRLVSDGMAKGDGWARVSRQVWPLVDGMPTDLVEREKAPDGSGRARLTATGQAVWDWS